MIAVISGRIVNSWKVNPNAWLFKLKQFFASFGDTPLKWEIFGGNAFLLRLNYPEESLFVAIIIKAIFRQVEDLDIEIKIGIGEAEASYEALRKMKGTAISYTRWDESDKIPQKPAMLLCTGNELFDREFNLLMEFALLNMNQWSLAEAEIVELCMLFPEKNQQELAEWLRIRQSAVSQRRSRSQLDLLLRLDQYFRTKIKTLLTL